MTYSNAANQSTPPSGSNGPIALLKRLLKILLLLGVGYLAFVYSADIRQQLTTYVGNAMRYSKLIKQDPPQPNSLPTPIPNAHLIDTWGAARSGGRHHEGIDIFAARGTPIHSTTPGIVRKVGTDSLGGNVVSILGPGGVGHYYAHLQQFADIQPGDWVEVGTVLGYVGDSGNAKGTPPHVHYGIYTQSGAVNPYPLLAK